jgi:hypothetical protein
LRPLVSVCIPAYRQPHSLLRAVESVLSQKGPNFEIVITDDSEDPSVETAIRSYLTDRRIHYFKNQSRLGAVANWNESLRRASGSILKILHHDDWLNVDNALDVSVEPILQRRTQVAFCACRAMSVSGAELFMHRTTPDQIAELQKHPARLALGNVIGAPSVAAFGANIGVEFDTHYTYLADLEFYIRLIEATDRRFVYVDEPLICVTNDSPEQLSRTCEANRLGIALENILLFSQDTASDLDKSHVCRHFERIGHDLPLRKLPSAARFALGRHRYDIAAMLLQGYVRRSAGGRWAPR